MQKDVEFRNYAEKCIQERKRGVVEYNFYQLALETSLGINTFENPEV